jgi:tetratricopeptide (TPR) repeat protein
VAGPAPALAIPATLQASLLARLDRLAPVREVAQIGAALGRQFSHELITAVAALPHPELDDALAELVGAELIYRRGTPPDAEYTFKHALVQDAAYSTLLRSRRQKLHARIAATLEGRFPEIVMAQPALLAHHCAEGGQPEKAVEYWLSAGQQAWGRSAAVEAVALLRRGLALVPALPDTDWRREREFDLQIAHGQALIASRSWGTPEVGPAYDRARQLAVALNRPRALLFPLWGQFIYHWARADLQRARRIADEIVALGEVSGDVPTRVMGCDASATACYHLGDFTAGRAYAEKGLALYDRAQRQAYAELMPNDALVELQVRSSHKLVCLGHFDQARSRVDAALAEARRLDHPPTLCFALVGTVVTGWSVRLEPKSLLEYTDEVLTLSVEHELGFFRATALCWRGWCLAALGQADEGMPILTTGMAGVAEVGFTIYRPAMLTNLAEACRMGGQLPAALGHLAEAERLAEATGDRWFHSETLRLRGDVLLAMGDRAAAVASYGEALALAQQQHAKLWELRTTTSLARLWRDQGKRIEAIGLLAPVFGWFTEGFGTPALQEAKALLEELSDALAVPAGRAD